ncbi:hypothetical protein [Catenulispora pinisilvae]|uniref:hypothetical protein n=1 Tax=Catenulispora pinisilvae TaxID=2705253 RepID=UPI00189246F6|nr:hypothetical protein [Catenulispora pinisilvae]
MTALTLLLAAATAGAIAVAPASVAAASPAGWQENLAQAHSDDVNAAWTGHALGIRNAHATTAHSSVGYAMDTFPAHPLSAATNQFTVIAGEQQPSGTRVEVDIRGQAANGSWTEWTPAVAGGATRLSASANLVQTRVTLRASASGATPSVSSIAVTADPTRTAAVAAPNATTNPLSYKVYATDEGLVGGTTANGHVIQPNDHFVALPSGSALSPQGSGEYSVQVCGPVRCETAPVWDVGPWNIHDNYWDNPRAEFTDLPQGEPEAQAAYDNGYNGDKSDIGSTVVNPAGIDLADGTFSNIGLTDNGDVTVTYLWTSGGTPPPPAAYSQGSGGRVATGVHADGRAEVFAVTPSGGIQNKYETSAGGAWSGWNGFGPSGTAVAVAAGRHADGRLEVFAVMSDGSMQNRYETVAGGAWSGWNSYAPAGTAKDAVVGVHADGRLEVFAVTPSGGVQNKYEKVADGAWSGWNGFGPSGTVDAVTAARHSDGRLEVFAVLTDGSMQNRYETVADGAWSGWNSYAAASTAKGTGSPGVDAAGAHEDGRLEVFAVTPSGGIENRYEKVADGAWSGWNGFGPSGVATSATVVRHSDGRLEVFAVMSDGSMQNRYETVAGGAWSGWNGFASAGTAHV